MSLIIKHGIGEPAIHQFIDKLIKILGLSYRIKRGAGSMNLESGNLIFLIKLCKADVRLMLLKRLQTALIFFFLSKDIFKKKKILEIICKHLLFICFLPFKIAIKAGMALNHNCLLAPEIFLCVYVCACK